MVNLFHHLKSSIKGKQIFCFPYLGGYANSFYDLAKNLSDDIDVWSLNLPGHGSSKCKPVESLEVLLDQCLQSIKPLVSGEYVLFGHSMGGIIAFLLAQRIIKCDDCPSKPKALVLSACNAPMEFDHKHYSVLSDDDLIKHLFSYNGISEELLGEKSLINYFLPVYRSDFRLLENSTACSLGSIELPVHYFWGEADPIVGIESATLWQTYFSNSMTIHPFKNASHMFLHELVDLVAKKLERLFL